VKKLISRVAPHLNPATEKTVTDLAELARFAGRTHRLVC
jgi:hypothetical protein